MSTRNVYEMAQEKVDRWQHDAEITIIRTDRPRFHRWAWSWQVMFRSSPDAIGYGIGGWARTRSGARFAAWRMAR